MFRQVHVFYSGSVQGVGFRYTAVDRAQDLGVGGWVKNLPDGRVEVVAQADEQVLQAFLERIKKDFSRVIRDERVSWESALDTYKDFSITR
jgi:acylphosphatase